MHNSRLVLVDKNMSPQAKSLLNELGISTIDTVAIPQICGATATHPDMQFVVLADRCAMVARQAYAYYAELLPDFRLIPADGISSPYPNDCKLNFTVVGNKCLMTDFQLEVSQDYGTFEPVIIRQGYSKCNICVLSDSAIITSDRGIIKASQSHAIRAYYLPNDEIALTGYKCGFWGGCTGLIGDRKLFFNGNIEKLSCFYELSDILQKEKIEPFYPKNTCFEDNGSIITIY